MLLANCDHRGRPRNRSRPLLKHIPNTVPRCFPCWCRASARQATAAVNDVEGATVLMSTGADGFNYSSPPQPQGSERRGSGREDLKSGSRWAVWLLKPESEREEKQFGRIMRFFLSSIHTIQKFSSASGASVSSGRSKANKIQFVILFSDVFI